MELLKKMVSNYKEKEKVRHLVGFCISLNKYDSKICTSAWRTICWSCPKVSGSKPAFCNSARCSSPAAQRNVVQRAVNFGAPGLHLGFELGPFLGHFLVILKREMWMWVRCRLTRTSLDTAGWSAITPFQASTPMSCLLRPSTCSAVAIRSCTKIRCSADDSYETWGSIAPDVWSDSRCRLSFESDPPRPSSSQSPCPSSSLQPEDADQERINPPAILNAPMRWFRTWPVTRNWKHRQRRPLFQHRGRTAGN